MRAQARQIQQAVFLCEIKEHFHILEKFVELIPKKNTTIGSYIRKALLQCLAAKNLYFSRLVSITTDGAP